MIFIASRFHAQEQLFIISNRLLLSVYLGQSKSNENVQVMDCEKMCNLAGVLSGLFKYNNAALVINIGFIIEVHLFGNARRPAIKDN